MFKFFFSLTQSQCCLRNPFVSQRSFCMLSFLQHQHYYISPPQYQTSMARNAPPRTSPSPYHHHAQYQTHSTSTSTNTSTSITISIRPIRRLHQESRRKHPSAGVWESEFLEKNNKCEEYLADTENKLCTSLTSLHLISDTHITDTVVEDNKQQRTDMQQ